MEDKQLENALSALVSKIKDLKASIASFLLKLETEYQTLQWPTVLDNFLLISSQMNSLSRLLKSDKCPAFRNYVVIPLSFSTGKDPHLETLTEGRLPVINHEIAPDYLRTKPQPEVEEKITQIVSKSLNPSSEALQKQINSFNRILNQNIDTITNSRDHYSSDSIEKRAAQSMWSRDHTSQLVSAVTSGRGLSHSRRSENLGQRHPGSGQQMHMSNKSVSGLKTTMRSSAHPYSRP